MSYNGGRQGDEEFKDAREVLEDWCEQWDTEATKNLTSTVSSKSLPVLREEQGQHKVADDDYRKGPLVAPRSGYDVLGYDICTGRLLRHPLTAAINNFIAAYK